MNDDALINPVKTPDETDTKEVSSVANEDEKDDSGIELADKSQNEIIPPQDDGNESSKNETSIADVQQYLISVSSFAREIFMDDKNQEKSNNNSNSSTAEPGDIPQASHSFIDVGGVDVLDKSPSNNVLTWASTSGMKSSCKTLKCPKCNWHYKYQETLDIHMKDKHPEADSKCLYCASNQVHPRLSRGENYTCGYKPYRCDVCNYSTTTKGNLSIHMQSDKHLNNMQDVQCTSMMMSFHDPNNVVHAHPSSSLSCLTSPYIPSLTTTSPFPIAVKTEGPFTPVYSQNFFTSQNSKTTPFNIGRSNWKCDICNYDTSIARNLRIHMSSDKHLQNLMVLSKSKSSNNQLPYLFSPPLPCDTGSVINKNNFVSEDDLATNASSSKTSDLNQIQSALLSLLKQSVTAGNSSENSGWLNPSTITPLSCLGQFNILDSKMSGSECFSDLPEVNPAFLFTCCICKNYSTDSVELMASHTSEDRSRKREHEVCLAISGTYLCKLCSYRTNLKANFQLHCKTDKHIHKLSFINHIKEGVMKDEFNVNNLNYNNSTQIHCNACNFHANSVHKIQCHIANPIHEIQGLQFDFIRRQEHELISNFKGNTSSDQVESMKLKFECLICEYVNETGKTDLLQHARSVVHLKKEQLYRMTLTSKCSSNVSPFENMFNVSIVKENVNIQENGSGRESDQVDRVGGGREFSGSERTDGLVEKNAVEPIEEESAMDFTCPICRIKQDTYTGLEMHALKAHYLKRENLKRLMFSGEYQSSEKVSTDSRTDQDDDINVDVEITDDMKDITEIGTVSNKHLYRFRCTSCSLAFKTADKLSLHSKYHEFREASTCKKCQKSFRTMAAFMKHIDTFNHDEPTNKHQGSEQSSLIPKYSDPNRPHKCDICSESFTQRSILLVHYNSVCHLNKVKKILQNKQGDNSNLLIDNNESKKTFVALIFRCNMCSLQFDSQPQLDDHVKSNEHEERASRLYELILNGQVDLTKPLIQQPSSAEMSPEIGDQVLSTVSPNSTNSLHECINSVKSSPPKLGYDTTINHNTDESVKEGPDETKQRLVNFFKLIALNTDKQLTSDGLENHDTVEMKHIDNPNDNQIVHKSEDELSKKIVATSESVSGVKDSTNLLQYLFEFQRNVLENIYQKSRDINPLELHSNELQELNPLLAMQLQPPLITSSETSGTIDSASVMSFQSSITDVKSVNEDNNSRSSQFKCDTPQTSSHEPVKRARTRISESQLRVLRSNFDINNSPNEEKICHLASQTGLPTKVVKHWFRNTLFKERQKNKDSPYNFNNPPVDGINLNSNLDEELKKAKKMPDMKVENKDSPQVSSKQNSLICVSEEYQTTNHSKHIVNKDDSNTFHPFDFPNLSMDLSDVETVLNISLSNSSSSDTSTSRQNVESKHVKTNNLTHHQIKLLQDFFDRNSFPKEDELNFLSNIMGISPKTILMWFHSARQKAKDIQQYQTNVMSDEIKSYISNSTKFTRTPGLNYKCNKCPLVVQRYYELMIHQSEYCYKSEKGEFVDNNEEKDDTIDSSGIVIKCPSSSLMPNEIQLLKSPLPPSSILTSSDLTDLISRHIEQASRPISSGLSTTTSKETSFPETSTPINSQQENLNKAIMLASNICCQTQQMYQEASSRSSSTASLFSNLYTPAADHTSGKMSVGSNDHLFNKDAFGEMSNNATSSLDFTENVSSMKRKLEIEDIDVLSDEQGSSRDKRLRTTILPEQLDFLYCKYQMESNPSRKMLEQIANEVGLRKRVVQVWFQNTRARERKGQFRAHQQVINKRCPFCPALFKVRSALESHLTAKHSDQNLRTPINIDNIPDADVNDIFLNANASMSLKYSSMPLSNSVNNNVTCQASDQLSNIRNTVSMSKLFPPMSISLLSTNTCSNNNENSTNPNFSNEQSEKVSPCSISQGESSSVAVPLLPTFNVESLCSNTNYQQYFTSIAPVNSQALDLTSSCPSVVTSLETSGSEVVVSEEYAKFLDCIRNDFSRQLTISELRVISNLIFLKASVLQKWFVSRMNEGDSQSGVIDSDSSFCNCCKEKFENDRNEHILSEKHLKALGMHFKIFDDMNVNEEVPATECSKLNGNEENQTKNSTKDHFVVSIVVAACLEWKISASPESLYGMLLFKPLKNHQHQNAMQ